MFSNSAGQNEIPQSAGSELAIIEHIQGNRESFDNRPLQLIIIVHFGVVKTTLIVIHVCRMYNSASMGKRIT